MFFIFIIHYYSNHPLSSFFIVRSCLTSCQRFYNKNFLLFSESEIYNFPKQFSSLKNVFNWTTWKSFIYKWTINKEKNNSRQNLLTSFFFFRWWWYLTTYLSSYANVDFRYGILDHQSSSNEDIVIFRSGRFRFGNPEPLIRQCRAMET